jgi:hypothetical protein
VSYCLVRTGVTLNDYLRDVRHRRHRHISAADKEVLLERCFVEWLSKPHGVLRFVTDTCRFSMRDQSARHGAFLAAAIRQREPWALIVQSEIEGRRKCKR